MRQSIVKKKTGKKLVTKGVNKGQHQDTYKYYIVLDKKWYRGGDTEGEAREELNKKIVELQDGELNLSTIKVGKAVKQWLEVVEVSVKGSTYISYTVNINPFLAKYQDKRLSDISYRHIEMFSIELLKTYAHNTTKEYMRVVKQFYKWAIKNNYVKINPATLLTLPKHAPAPMNIFNAEEIQTLLQNYERFDQDGIMYMVQILTGLRQGELLNLRWAREIDHKTGIEYATDIDLVNAKLHVQQIYTRGKYTTPKTDSSRRSVDLTPHILTILKKWKLQSRPNPNNLVFCGTTGKILSDTTHMNKWVAVQKNLGVKVRDTHNLRHTNASLRIKAGQTLPYIASQLGHSSPAITLKIYAHLIPQDHDFVKTQATAMDNMVASMTVPNLVGNPLEVTG